MNGCQPFNEIRFHTCGSYGGYSFHPIVLQVPVVAGCRISKTGFAWAKGRRLNTLSSQGPGLRRAPLWFLFFLLHFPEAVCLHACCLGVVDVSACDFFIFFLSVCATTLCDLCPSSDNLTAALFKCSDGGRLTEARTFFRTYIYAFFLFTFTISYRISFVGDQSLNAMRLTTAATLLAQNHP